MAKNKKKEKKHMEANTPHNVSSCCASCGHDQKCHHWDGEVVCCATDCRCDEFRPVPYGPNEAHKDMSELHAPQSGKERNPILPSEEEHQTATKAMDALTAQPQGGKERIELGGALRPAQPQGGKFKAIPSEEEERAATKAMDALTAQPASWEEEFDREFVRDDGLMDKYHGDENGDPEPLALTIKRYIASLLRSAHEEDEHIIDALHDAVATLERANEGLAKVAQKAREEELERVRKIIERQNINCTGARFATDLLTALTNPKE